MAFRTLLLCGAAAAADVKLRYHRIKSFDGTELTANSWEPDVVTSPLPLVITGNSWQVPGFEYIWPGYEMAERGYIALEYTSRGWYTSGGEIDTAGPKDVRDHSVVIDWALEHWGDKVNRSAIAVGGISYGAGIALLVAANDSRITTAFSMSTWGSLVDSLWWNQAPSVQWIQELVSGAQGSGKPPQELLDMTDNLLNHKNINMTIAWGNLRSPRTYIDQLNARKVPVLISNQFEDDLFHAHDVLAYWQRLQGPKRLLLNQGTHGEAEAKGAVPLKSHIWERAFAWLDRFLKGIANGVDKAPLVEMSLSDHHDPLIPGQPVYTHKNFSSWPPVEPAEKYQVRTYSLVSRTAAGGQFGKLVEGAAPRGTDTIAYTNDTLMTTGKHVFTPALQPIIPHTINAEKIDAQYELAFLTEPVAEATRFCGTFNVTGLVVTPTSSRFQVMGYLWSAKPKNLFGSRKAALLSHAPEDVWEGATAGQPFALRPLTFHAACRDLKKGDSLMLGLNMHNGRYEGADESARLSLSFDYSGVRLHVSQVEAF